MLAEVYNIRPWEMARLTSLEWKLIVDVEKQRAKEARKQARSR